MHHNQYVLHVMTKQISSIQSLNVWKFSIFQYNPTLVPVQYDHKRNSLNDSFSTRTRFGCKRCTTGGDESISCLILATGDVGGIIAATVVVVFEILSFSNDDGNLFDSVVEFCIQILQLLEYTCVEC
ncbi:hypothetical protein DERF_013734 [Dermatophagoides farinae]|uniref:Uncharacterized protein n=1 Tax=Dermatophagoides farinae TaxID=6954 RepID=A0A922KWX0_DERFA|nr:hypothetical protein DERF_013734 [Dermatophagoides farinae]